MQTCNKPKAKPVAYNLIAALGQVELKTRCIIRYGIKAGHVCWVIKYIDFGFCGQKCSEG